ncbi:alpha/beta fold hydrolase [Algiphilus sp.]|uniref:alpha/beta hydrolase n=1 Tax=Algiphilus sp. TaxID=1872431 RepID=UPI0025BF7EB2|nr:alpha/beta fold hydrolase [Algiphilus sp.]MCK5769723.1 alpha/beta fold hydrolase [Algiphilus sp.]
MGEALHQRNTAVASGSVRQHDLVLDAGGTRVGASVWLPDGAAPAALFFCLPGGHMTRGYFDLRVPGNDSHSFARAMAAQGFAVAAIDHPGTGDSDDGGDRYRHTPESLADVAAAACGRIVTGLRAGSLVPGAAPVAALPTIGVGHSMGAMITVLHQQREPTHAAIAVLGFSTRGLPEYVPEQVRALLDDRDALRAQRVELARAMFAAMGESSGGGDGDIYGREGAESDGILALRDCRAPLLPTAAFCSMLPDNVGPEAAEVAVPVFIGLGSRDMAGAPHKVPAAFTGSGDVCLHILPGAGHSHFLFPSRAGLFRRLAHWATRVAAPEATTAPGVISTS